MRPSMAEVSWSTVRRARVSRSARRRQVACSARQREEAVSRASETGVTRARRTTRPSRCSGLSSTGSDLDVADLLLGLFLGRREHPHLLLERLELIVRLL